LALREMHAASTARYQRLAMFLATILLTVSGPFGTFQSFNLGQRFAYWACTVVACYLIGQGAATFFIEILRPQISQKWPRVIIAGLIASLPVTVVVLLINGDAYQHIAVAESLTIWLYVTVVTLVVVVTLVTIDEVMAGAHPRVEEPVPAAAPPIVAPAVSEPSPPRILQRVPPRQRGQLLALIVEDHYVDIVTDKGKTLVLMRLADAIGESVFSQPGDLTSKRQATTAEHSHNVAELGVLGARAGHGSYPIVDELPFSALP